MHLLLLNLRLYLMNYIVKYKKRIIMELNYV
nr:MAG TPA: hypothetical protein [Bacteriophage sp.]